MAQKRHGANDGAKKEAKSAAGKQAAAGSPEGGGGGETGPVFRFALAGRGISLYLGRLPELILLMAFAWYVAQTLVDQMELTLPMSLPMGLFAARQVQKLLAWLRGEEGRS
eukprot:TRINITY_DN58799_c0_g1_i1.p3 TRINITY_DN58799_c0_g1~~TRINITY_DN58799_c0_g1_i1.p3  ORF type:complete len:126 (+),score=31.44 TRINITY_DN58799_c0_g1_i1:46-378(+)